MYPVISKITEDAEIKQEKEKRIIYERIEKRISEELTEDEREKLSEPANAAVLQFTIGRMICCNSLEKRRLLEDILIEKAKSRGKNDEEQDYDRAIRSAYELTINEIQLLVFIETYSTIVCSIINGTGAIENVQKLYSYLENSSFVLEEIKKCEYNFLLFERSLYEHDLSALKEYHNEDIAIENLCSLVKNILIKHYDVDINLAESVRSNTDIVKLVSYRLTNSGKIIARCEINKIGVNYVANDVFPLKLSNIIADNIYSLGSMAAQCSVL